jgi:hypothetical protein
LSKRYFAQPVQRSAVGLSILAFLLSLLAGGFTYLMLVAHYPRVGAVRMTSSDRRLYLWSTTATFAGFIFGMGQLAWFFAANWFGWGR